MLLEIDIGELEIIITHEKFDYCRNSTILPQRDN